MKKTFLTCLMAFAMLTLSAQSSKVNFRGVLALLQQTGDTFLPVSPETAEAAGLRLVFYSCYDEGDFDSSAIYYSYNANVLGEQDENYNRKMEKTGGNACVLGVEASSGSSGSIRFSNKEDYDRFFREAKAYGLLQDKDGDETHYYINATPLKGGKVIKLSNQELFAAFMGEENPKYYPQFMLVPKGKDETGWHTYNIGIDF